MFKHKKKEKNTLAKNITTKTQHNFSIRVLYKKTNKVPEEKIIPNIKRLKKAIIKNSLDIIPYENVFIICSNQKLNINSSPNILLPLKTIYGDFILVKINRKEREFESLSQEDIMWYTQDLINKSNIQNTLSETKRPSVKNFMDFYERDFEKGNNGKTVNYETTIINSLTTIEMTLIKLLKGKNKK